MRVQSPSRQQGGGRLPILVSMLGAAALSVTGSVRAEDNWDLTGYAGIEVRAFAHDARYPGQSSGAARSALAQTEFYWQADDGGARFAAVVFGRADSVDDERSHVDLREANFGFIGDGWDLNLGVSKVFWGVTESRHLVDVINQSDLVEDIDEEDKLGQPMLNVNFTRDFGRLELYVLPRFRERTFPGRDGRLRAPLPVDTDAVRYESADGRRHADAALRFSQYFGDIDFGAYVFDGTSREPRFELHPDGTRLIPVYDQMRQLGMELQLTRDAWLWKLEAMARETRGETFQAAVGGFEYTFFGVSGTATDVGVLFELLYDGRSEFAPPTVFDNDVFAGARLALNDSGDTSVLAGAVVDVDTHETFLNIEAERRFGERLKLDGRIRAFGHARPGEASYGVMQDDYVEVGLSWYY